MALEKEEESAMKKIFVLVMVWCCSVIIGCSSKINSNYSQPNEYTESTTRIFNASYDKVWKAAVDSIGKSFFVLENIEKDSGIMSLSFSSKNPSDFIDCGTTVDSGKLHGKDYSLSYSNTDTHLMKWLTLNDIPVQCARGLKFNGKSNIIVNKISTDKTSVNVNTRYIVALTYTCSLPYQVGFNTFYKEQSVNYEMVFTGNERGTFEQGGMSCVSKKTLEKNILDNIEKHIN